MLRRHKSTAAREQVAPIADVREGRYPAACALISADDTVTLSQPSGPEELALVEHLAERHSHRDVCVRAQMIRSDQRTDLVEIRLTELILPPPRARADLLGHAADP
jgi:hypothetical protein